MEISRENFMNILNHAFISYLLDKQENNPAIGKFLGELSYRIEFDKDKIIIIGIKD